MKDKNKTKLIVEYGSLLYKGDNLTIMNFLLNQYEGKIDLVYIDPPFNTGQVFYVDENRTRTISYSSKNKVAYKDKKTLNEFLKFMRKRFLIIYKLLSEEGSLYVHIDSKMVHYFKIMLDEIFGLENFKNDISRIKSNPKNFSRKAYGNCHDRILFYVKNNKKNIWNDVKLENFKLINFEKKFPKLDKFGNRYTTVPLHAPGESKGETGTEWLGVKPPIGRHWRYSLEKLNWLEDNGMIEWSKNKIPRLKKYMNDFNGEKVQDIWTFKDPQYPDYPTEKNLDMVSFIVKQSSNINSLVLDCFCGGGNTLLASHLNNRRFIGIDNSSMAINKTTEKLIKFNCFYKKF